MDLYQITENDVKNNLINLNQIVFEVTTSCNLNCDYCIYSGMYEGFEQLTNNYLSFNKSRLVLDYLCNVWKENNRYYSSKPMFIGFYGGEPLLNISLIKQIVNYVETNFDKRQKVIFSMTTNGLLLHSHIDYLVEKNFQLLISLDGNYDMNFHRKTKNMENSFPIVYKNVKNIQEKYPEYFKKHVNFNAVFTQKSTFKLVHNFFIKEFDKIPRIAQVDNSRIRRGQETKFKSIFKNIMDDINADSKKHELNTELFLSSPIVRLVSNFIHNDTGNTYKSYNDLFIDKNKVNIVPTGTCLPFQKKMFLTVNGKILQCEKISQEYELGHVTDEQVFLDYNQIAINFNRLVRTFYEQCTNCYMKHNCSVCLLKDCSLEEQRYHICKSYCTFNKYRKYWEHCLNYLKEDPNLYSRIINEITYY